MSGTKPIVVCVDDEPRVLTGLNRLMREDYAVLSATSGAAGLKLLEQNPATAIVLSDMRMPEMDGAAFLAHARGLRPNAVRILLTGHADQDAAIRSINHGEVFRFITKPCAPDRLALILQEARRHHDLVMAEKTLLQRTLVGCVKTLVEMMAFACPAAMGRAVRLKRRVSAITTDLDLERGWEVEAAALFSELGSLCAPEELLGRMDVPETLTAEERAKAGQAMRAANELIAHVPRLAPVSRLLQLSAGLATPDPTDYVERTHVQLLRLATELDRLELAGAPAIEAVASLASRNAFDRNLIDAAARCAEHAQDSFERNQVDLAGLRLGMIIAEDVVTRRGALIAPRGCEVTESFLQRMRNFTRHMEQPKFVVLKPRPADE